ncbi:MAG TPA: hypothetical protein VJL84_04795 [Kiloniellales bacterium]|nr:hypothetical protein [Kiloniellales bacterium]
MNDEIEHQAFFDHMYRFSADIASEVFWVDMAVNGRSRDLWRDSAAFPDLMSASWQSGSATLSDVIGTSHGTALFSDRALAAVRSAKVSGFAAHGRDILAKRCAVARLGRVVSTYNLLFVAGRCGPLDRAGLRTIHVQHEGKVAAFNEGIKLDPETWDGSDVFMPDNTSMVIVADRVRKLFKTEGLTGAKFEALRGIRMLSSVSRLH